MTDIIENLLKDVPDQKGWLADLRKTSAATSKKLGLPNRKVEAWKYTNLNALLKCDFSTANPASASPKNLDENMLFDGPRLVLVDGHFDAGLSDLSGLPKGVSFGPLMHAIDEQDDDLSKFIGTLSDKADSSFAYANQSSFSDGMYLHVARGVAVDKVIQLILIATDHGPDNVNAYHLRHLIRLDAGASAHLVERHISDGALSHSLSNSVCETFIDQDGYLGHYKLQDEAPDAFHIALTRAQLQKASRYENTVMQLGGAVVRNEIRTIMQGEHGDCRLMGVSLGSDEQIIDNTTFVDHAVPNCDSHEVYKTVLDDRARGIFQGNILVRPDAQKTNGNQMCRALLLSDKAEMDAKPELEIYADDVKCSHGTTIGELDDAQLFYLRSRGIDEKTARAILIRAFLLEVVDAIQHPLIAQQFHDILAQHLGAHHIGSEDFGEDI